MASHHDREEDSATEQMHIFSVHDHDEKPDLAEKLPSPVSSPAIHPPRTGKTNLSVIIAIWICLSSAVIIYNNYLYNTLNFRYPVFLVICHLSFAVSALVSQLILVRLCLLRGWRIASGRLWYLAESYGL